MKDTKTLKELKAEVKAIAIKRKEEVMAKIEEKRLQNELSYLKSEQFIQDTIKMEDKSILKAVSDILEAVSDKKFTLYREFSFNENLNNLIGAIKTVTFQKASGWPALNEAIAEHDELSNFVEVVEPVAGQLIDALGRNTYYDKLSHTIVEGASGDTEEAVQILSNIARELGLTELNTKQINEVNFKTIEEKAQKRANQQYEDNAIIRDDVTVYTTKDTLQVS